MTLAEALIDKDTVFALCTEWSILFTVGGKVLGPGYRTGGNEGFVAEDVSVDLAYTMLIVPSAPFFIPLGAQLL